MTKRRELTDEQIDQAWEGCGEAGPGTLKVWILAARWAESAITADRALQGEQDALDAARLDWIEDRTRDSSHSIQVRLVRRLVRYPAIQAGVNRIELRTSCGSGAYERAFEGNSLRSAIDAARDAQGATE